MSEAEARAGLSGVFAWAIVMILIMLAMDKLVFDGVAWHFGRWR